MSLENALKKASEIMVNAATHYAKDLGEKKYSVEMHAEASGYAMRVLFAPKREDAERLPQTDANYAAVFHALYNHSAWRQKHEKAKLFEAQSAKASSYSDRLSEEMGE